MRHKLLAPEVIQASAMDCGPASLKSLLEGFGTHVSFGRLREACQTDVDGTSIDAMEEVALQLGLDAEQTMLPLDHLLLDEVGALPAIVVVRLPGGATHFLVLWRRHGRMLQLMDPAIGRRWIAARRFLSDVYIHTSVVSAESWCEWARSEASIRMLRRRLRDLGIDPEGFVNIALARPGWREPAALDAGIRLVASIVEAGGVRRGRQARQLLERLLAREGLIPAEYWSVRPSGESKLMMRGAVLVRVKGRLEKQIPEAAPLSQELAAALSEAPSHPGRDLLRLLRVDGLFSPVAVTFTLLIAAAGVILEAMLFRGVLDIGRDLENAGQRLAAVAALFGLLLVQLGLEFPLSAGLLRMGRHLEIRLRQAFLEKIPRLGDRYFQSRLKSDMAERSHAIHRVRRLPELGGELLRAIFELALTASGIAWLDPASAPLAAVAAAASVMAPLSMKSAMTERDLRARSHAGALSRYYLDALVGLVPIRVHGAQRALRREHASVLVEWTRAGIGLQRVVAWSEGLQFALGFGFAAVLLLFHLARNGEAGAALLLVYWSLNLPALGQQVALAIRQYPACRNATLRLLEPLGALEEEPPARDRVPDEPLQAASIAFHNVSVRVAGHTILEDINLQVAPGEHVGIVGRSGAGKSSLVGILLGWYRPVTGSVSVDGAPLDTGLRNQIAWIEPGVHLWNRSLYDNLCYGSAESTGRSMAQVIEATDLRRVLDKLPDGFGTRLGESGALVSGGEGQRVRMGRALLRPGVRLVILDEPFRGLDRQQRRDLLARIRSLWKDITLLCITHDVGETKWLDRVLVMKGGRIVEQGSPGTLSKQPDSHYRALLQAEEALGADAWSGANWRRLRLEEGELRCEQRAGSHK